MPVNPAKAIPADLLTPLGAYLRLRGEGGGSFLLESVERGRLGRNSFVGRGSRVVTLEEAETLDLPVVGYVSYDYAAKLEPTVPIPEDGAGLPESSFIAVETLVRFDHGAGVAEVLAGDPEDVARRLALPLDEPSRSGSGEARAIRRFPEQARYEEMVRTCQDYIRAGDAYQIVPSQRAERQTSASPLALYRALRRRQPVSRTSSCSSSTSSPSSARHPSGWSRVRTGGRASARSRGRRLRARETSSASSLRRRTAPST